MLSACFPNLQNPMNGIEFEGTHTYDLPGNVERLREHRALVSTINSTYILYKIYIHAYKGFKCNVFML